MGARWQFIGQDEQFAPDEIKIIVEGVAILL